MDNEVTPVGEEFPEEYEKSWSPQSETPTEVVVRSIAAVTNRDPLDLEPLHSVIKLNDLYIIFQRTARKSSQSVTVEFRYEGYEVSLDSSKVRLQKTHRDSSS